MKRFRRMAWVLAVLVGVYAFAIWSLSQRYVTPFRPSASKPADFREEREGNLVFWSVAPAKRPKGSFVLVHGYGGSPDDWVGLARILRERGYASFIPHMPAHAESPETRVGFGDRESEVVIETAQIAKRRYGVPIMAHGISLGGAAAWVASERAPELFAAIGSEGAFASLIEGSKAYLGSAWPVLYPIIPVSSQIAGVDPATIVPERAARKWHGKPALIIHGEEDQLFPIVFGEQLAAASGATLWRVPGTGHAQVMGEHLEEVADRLIETLPSR